MSNLSLRDATRTRRRQIKYLNDYFCFRRQFANNPISVDVKVFLQAIFRPRKIILFFPEAPAGSVAFKLCALLGYTISNNPRRRFDVAVKWKDSTYFDPEEFKKIPAGNGRIINAASLDISKHKVNQVFAKVFGYPLAVNPLEFHGKIVEKSDRNASHDGRVLNGPLKPAELLSGRVYQKAIDNSSNIDGLIVDHRMPVIAGVIPLVYLKYRPQQTRFSNKNSFAKLEKVETVFSSSELEKISLMVKEMGLDYGEVDVLRDKDGRIYVVDVNNTPHGPPNGLPNAEAKTALAMMAKDFELLIEGFA